MIQTDYILPPTPTAIARAVRALKDGQLVAIPTETVYGLAADASNERAVQSIFTLKGRPSSNPLIVHVATSEMALALGNFETNPRALTRFRAILASPLVPGPLSCVIPKGNSIAPSVTAGGDTVCVRLPQHPVTAEIILKSGLALAAPSANRSTEVSPSQALHVYRSFQEESPLIIDGGNCDIGIESTVVDLTRDEVLILRAGAITAEEISSILAEPVHEATHRSPPPEAPRSPGIRFAHYQPKTRLCWLTPTDHPTSNKQAAILFAKRDSPFSIVRYASDTGDLNEIAHNLYALLHELDGLKLECLYVESCEERGIGKAIMDRLRRAVTSL